MATGWQDIHDEALRRIQTRDWIPGALIPNEAALAREFGCARATVNRALQSLAEAGWLERRRRAGTRVTLSPQRRAQLAIPLIRHDIESKGQVFSHIIITRQTAEMPSPQRAALGLQNAPDAQHVQTLYLADARAFAFEDRWVNLAVVPDFAAAPLESINPNEWLVQNAPFAHGTLDYSAAPAGTHAAFHLDCTADTPLMILERRTFSTDAPITHVRLAYAPGHHLHLKI